MQGSRTKHDEHQIHVTGTNAPYLEDVLKVARCQLFQSGHIMPKLANGITSESGYQREPKCVPSAFPGPHTLLRALHYLALSSLIALSPTAVRMRTR